MQFVIIRRRAYIFIALFLIRFIAQSVLAAEPENLKVLVNLAKPSTGELKWYRWGQKKFEEPRIGRVPAFRQDEFDLEQGNEGKGLHVFEDPVEGHLSVQEVAAQGKALVTVSAPAGTLVLDLTSDEVKKSLKKAHIEISDVFRVNPPVMIKYANDPARWILKSATNVRVQKFTGEELGPEVLLDLFGKLVDEESRKYFFETIRDSLKNRVYSGSLPEVFANATSECILRNSPETEIRSFLGPMIDVLEPKNEFQSSWSFDGKCVTYNPSKASVSVVSANMGECRSKYPTTYLKDQDGQCFEVVKDAPLIRVSSEPVETCKNDLVCLSGNNRGIGLGNLIQSIATPKGSELRLYRSYSECTRSLIQSENQPLICVPRESERSTLILKSLGMSYLPIYFESIEECIHSQSHADEVNKQLCVKEDKGVRILDYRNEFDMNLIGPSFSSIKECHEFLLHSAAQPLKNQLHRAKSFIEESKVNPKLALDHLSHAFPLLKKSFTLETGEEGTQQVKENVVPNALVNYNNQSKYCSIEKFTSKYNQYQNLDTILRASIIIRGLLEVIPGSDQNKINTESVIEGILFAWDFNDYESRLATEIISNLSLEQVAMDQITSLQARKLLEKSAERVSLDIKDFFELQSCLLSVEASIHPAKFGHAFEKVDPTQKAVLKSERLSKLELLITPSGNNNDNKKEDSYSSELIDRNPFFSLTRNMSKENLQWHALNIVFRDHQVRSAIKNIVRRKIPYFKTPKHPEPVTEEAFIQAIRDADSQQRSVWAQEFILSTFVNAHWDKDLRTRILQHLGKYSNLISSDGESLIINLAASRDGVGNPEEVRVAKGLASKFNYKRGRGEKMTVKAHSVNPIPGIGSQAAVQTPVHQKLEEVLFIGEPVFAKKLNSVGKNSVWRIQLKNPKTGEVTSAILKPRSGDESAWNKIEKEYVAYNISLKALGLDYVPPVAIRDNLKFKDEDTGKIVEVQRAALSYEVQSPQFLVDVPEEEWGTKKKILLSDHRILRTLLGDPDGHEDNVLFGAHWNSTFANTKSPVFIDFGASFISKKAMSKSQVTVPDMSMSRYSKHTGVFGKNVKVIRGRLYDRLKELKRLNDLGQGDQQFSELLDNKLISHEEARLFYERADHLLEYFDSLETQNPGKVIIPEDPWNCLDTKDGGKRCSVDYSLRDMHSQFEFYLPQSFSSKKDKKEHGVLLYFRDKPESREWVIKDPKVRKLAEEKDLVIVAISPPNGDNSWNSERAGERANLVLNGMKDLFFFGKDKIPDISADRIYTFASSTGANWSNAFEFYTNFELPMKHILLSGGDVPDEMRDQKQGILPFPQGMNKSRIPEKALNKTRYFYAVGSENGSVNQIKKAADYYRSLGLAAQIQEFPSGQRADYTHYLKAGVEIFEQASPRKEVGNCSHFDHLSTIKGETNAGIIEELWNRIENHDSEFKPYHSHKCDASCNDLSINSIYESLLVKNIIGNPDLNDRISKIYKKLFASFSQKNKGFEDVVKVWTNVQDPANKVKTLPVAQKQLLSSEQRFSELMIKNNPLMQFDFLLHNARWAEKTGTEKVMKEKRDRFFRKILNPLRGPRNDLFTGRYNKQLGISKIDLPELEIENGVPWKHWGRDICFVPPHGSMYAQAAISKNIPVVCGISGTTNLALWSVFSSKIDLSSEELRLLLLSIWSSLCADGGHSLQEVLATAKVNAIYLKEQFKIDSELRGLISEKTLDNLIEVTQEMNALGGPAHEHQPKIKFDELWNKLSKTQSIEQPEEAQLRKEMEHYFNQYGLNADNFGRYHDVFFKKLDLAAFKEAREKSRQELVSYFENSCQK
jgi:hypothetical protein